MPNEEHLNILTQGVVAWNEWRRQNPYIQPYLNDADLRSADLRGASLRYVQLGRVNLQHANLSGADLIGALLNGADLTEADLSHADLKGAKFGSANLSNANLRSTDLLYSIFQNAVLNDADFTGSRWGGTIMSEIDLSRVRGLETVDHAYPSTLGIETIYKSQGHLPEVFLRGAGVPETFLSYMPTLTRAEQSIQFYSCFISYSTKDEDFARRLYADLQSVGIRCWFAPSDLKIGRRLTSSINEAIRVHDKLLLILSEHAIRSDWIGIEVRNALRKELEQQSPVLFPVRLDDAVFRSREEWAWELKDRYIADFRDWKEPAKYQRSITRLIMDLKASLATESKLREQGHEN